MKTVGISTLTQRTEVEGSFTASLQLADQQRELIDYDSAERIRHLWKALP